MQGISLGEARVAAVVLDEQKPVDATFDSAEDDKYILVWAGMEVIENFYAANSKEAKNLQCIAEEDLGVKTKLYVVVRD